MTSARYAQETRSRTEFYTTPGLSGRATENGWMYYRSECAAQDFAPAHRINLEEMPSTFISCSEADPCRDELIMYASRLLRSYVSTELHVIAATFHGFDSVMPAFDGSKRLRLLHADTLARAFAY